MPRKGSEEAKRPRAGHKGSKAATCALAAELADLTPREARAHRFERIAALVGQGIRVRALYRQIAHEYGVAERTVRQDLRDLGRECRERLDRPESLHVEVDRTLARIRARAAAADTPANVAQRADEYLLRFLSTNVDRLTAADFGHDKAKHEATMARLDEQKAEAQVDLARAEATLARTRSERVDKPLVVVLRDLSAGVTDADVAAASPTYAEALGLEEGDTCD